MRDGGARAGEGAAQVLGLRAAVRARPGGAHRLHGRPQARDPAEPRYGARVGARGRPTARATQAMAGRGVHREGPAATSPVAPRAPGRCDFFSSARPVCFEAAPTSLLIRSEREPTGKPIPAPRAAAGTEVRAGRAAAPATSASLGWVPLAPPGPGVSRRPRGGVPQASGAPVALDPGVWAIRGSVQGSPPPPLLRNPCWGTDFSSFFLIRKSGVILSCGLTGQPLLQLHNLAAVWKQLVSSSAAALT